MKNQIETEVIRLNLCNVIHLCNDVLGYGKEARVILVNSKGNMEVV